ncbi:hypothetical protein [Pasteurella sp. PK-2025]|uniref:hypothetical protein n=1 Tax=Pasteurella sp. PK-2025 TaxID=3413133 RepID=UPI003C76A8CA
MSAEAIAMLLKQHNKDAMLSIHAGNYQQAIQYFLNSLAIEDHYDLGIHRARTRMNLANTYYLLQEYENASQVLSEAEQIFIQQHHLEECHYCHLLQAQILLSLHQLDEAEQLMKALLLKTRTEHIRGKARLILYKVYALQDQDKALPMLNQAIFTFERGEHQEELIEALQLRIDYYQQKGRHHLAAVDINKLNGLLAESL